MKKKSKIAIILLSGGIDSTACAHFLIKQGFAVSGLFVDYGQSAKQFEEESAKKISNYYKLDLKTHRIIPDNTFGSGEIIGRNAFLISLALMFSKIEQGIIALGIHAGTPYYDCSPDFFEQIKKIVKNYSSGQVDILAPFLEWTKIDIIQYCKKERIPIHLTYSCENGTLPQCEICNSCKDRKLMYVS